MSVKLGFIGVGHIPTHAHFPPLTKMVESGRVVFQAFCDASEETLAAQAKEYGVSNTYTHHHEMLEKESLDAIYLCIPPTLHTDAELIAAEKGIHLFVEKPQTLDIAYAAVYDEAIRKSGIVSQVGFMSRYYETSEKAAALLQDRTPRHAHLLSFYSGTPRRFWTSRMELCGGSFVENTIHMVDLLRYLLGDIQAVSAFYMDRKPDEGPEPMNLPHVYNVNYRFTSGVTANATVSRVLTDVPRGVGRREVMVVSDDSLMEWSTNKLVENGEAVLDLEGRPNAFDAQAEAFITAVEAEDASMMRSPYSDGMNSLAAVLGANESAKRGGKVILLDDLIAGTA
jgi:myo-inositol 2-dehydrogenase/D-chiro-inositol 1-dehydrogenase